MPPFRLSHYSSRFEDTPAAAPTCHCEPSDAQDWIGTWNENPRPYVWVKTEDQILEALGRYCEQISGAGQLA